MKDFIISDKTQTPSLVAEQGRQGYLMRPLQIGFLWIGILLFAILGLTGEGQAVSVSQIEIDLAFADLTLQGEDTGDWAGYFASPAGDVNGDGLGDVLVGAPMAGNKVCPIPGEDPCTGLPKGEGIAYLVLGRPNEAWPPTPMDLGSSDASFLGCEVTSMTARQLYTAGDVNGDGFDDMLISGWKCGLNYTGKAYLILGRSDVNEWGSEFPVEGAEASFLGENEWDQASYYTATAGDVNNDGLDDFLITSTHNDDAAENAGQVYLILGRSAADWGPDYNLANADASFLGEAVEDRLGRSVAGVGDVNADGYDDFLIGSISSDEGGENAGQSYLFLGRATEEDPRYDPNQPWWGMDYPVAGSDASFVGEVAGDESGRRVAHAGDINGDGYSDFMIGAALNDQGGPDAGKAYLVLGRAAADWGMDFSLSDADASFMGEVRRDQAGRRVSGAGDVNQDGYDDFLIGAPHYDDENDDDDPEPWAEGRAYLIYGNASADWGTNFSLRNADLVFNGKSDVGAAGYDLAWIGDFNGDEMGDFLITAYGGRNNNEVPGETYIILGSDAPIPFNFIPDSPEGQVAKWTRFTGDFWHLHGASSTSTVYLTLQEVDQNGLLLDARYDTSDGLFSLYESDGSLIGACPPGEFTKLSGEQAELDCWGSTVSINNEVLRVVWRIRWTNVLIPPQELVVKLRAVSLDGGDSGYKNFGTWFLQNHRLFLPAMQRQ